MTSSYACFSCPVIPTQTAMLQSPPLMASICPGVSSRPAGILGILSLMVSPSEDGGVDAAGAGVRLGGQRDGIPRRVGVRPGRVERRIDTGPPADLRRVLL